jgi:hypothetical protein
MVSFISSLNVALFGVISIILAWILPDQYLELAAWMYTLLLLYHPMTRFAVLRIRKRKFGIEV